MLLKSRAKLAGALLGLGFLTTVAIGAFTIEKIRVGGPMYDQIVQVKDLIADILPPPEYVIEAYLETTLALDNPSDFAGHRARLAQLRKDYNERFAYWKEADLPSDLKELLITASDREVSRFWRAVDGGLMPALDRSDQSAAHAAYRDATIAYRAHREIIDQVVVKANQLSEGIEASAARARKLLLTLAGCAMLVLLMGLIAIVIAASRSVVYPIERLTRTMRQLSAGNLEAEIENPERDDELGEMRRAVQVFKDNAISLREADAEKERLEAAAILQRRRDDEERARTAGKVAFVADALGTGLIQLAKGDLTYRLSNTFDPEYSKMQDDFNTAIAEVEGVILHIVGNVAEIHSSAEEIRMASNDLSRRTEQQAASLEETAAALDQITVTVKQSAERVIHANGVAAAARAKAEKCGGVVRQAVEAMSAIERSSQQISQIICAIDEIAFQTNLLALNAGVEAARAGEAGRGFAVVASEVRALAQRVASAAKEINSLISTSSAQVAVGVKLVRETGDDLERIISQVAEIDSLATTIAAATREQSTALAEVNIAINQMDQVTQQNAAMVEESTAASESLTEKAENLSRRVGRFKTGSKSFLNNRRAA